jgi:hypothetical protein
MKQIFTTFCVLSFILLLTACMTVQPNTQSIQGSGNLSANERSVSDFTSIQVNLGADLILTQSNSENLRIEAEDNLFSYIETTVLNGRLLVTTPNNISLKLTQPIKLYITFETLDSIEIFGTSNITAENLNLDTLSIAFSGSGSTRLTGTVTQQTINIQGQATINNFDLASRNVTVDISGSGTIYLNATDTLNVTVAGMGNIHYTGNPTITQNMSGAATITQEESK